jgi:hypothetical protein
MQAEDFSVSRERRDWLRVAGRAAARAFLEQFSLDQYTNTFERHLETVGEPQTPEL